MKKIKLTENSVYRFVTFLALSFLCIFFICFDSNISAAKKASLSGETQNEPTVKAALIDKSRSLPLYGFNGNTSKGPSWTNKAFRDSVSSLHLKAIRYPGGTVSSFWEWQKGGFVNDAPPQKFKGKNTPNTLQDLKLFQSFRCQSISVHSGSWNPLESTIKTTNAKSKYIAACRVLETH